MFIIRLLRFLRGYVRFRAQGVFVERFLNLAARDRIPIWDGHKREGVYVGYTSAASYRQLRRHAKKTGVRLRVCDKLGAPFHRRRHRRRVGVLVGLGLFFAFLYSMSLFIWRVEVTGNETISEARVLEALDTVGVHPGILRRSIDVRDCERQALLELSELSWIALNIDGSAIHVQVSEAIPKPDLVDPHQPCNVVASRDGRIVAMNIYDGDPLYQLGDPVLEGDVVVSGIMEDRRGQNLFRHARAQIMAEVEHTIVVEVPLQQLEYEETGKTVRRRYLQLLGLDLPLFLPTRVELPYHVDRADAPLHLFGLTLPVGVLTEHYTLMEEIPRTLSEEEAKREALDRLALAQGVELDGAEILEKQARASLEDGIFTLTCTYTCIMDIAQEKEILSVNKTSE